jgi:hypothetical protein
MNNHRKVNITQKTTTYPTVLLKNNQTLENRINRIIKGEAQSMLPAGRYTNFNIISAASQYDITVNQNQILSIRLENYFFPEKAANGVTKVKGITVNLINGKDYRLKDLFKANSNYQSVLNSIIERQIKEEDILLIEEFPGIRGNEEYYLTEAKLVIIYQRYELTPGYYGVLEFKIPYGELESVIDKRSPIYVIMN